MSISIVSISSLLSFFKQNFTNNFTLFPDCVLEIAS